MTFHRVDRGRVEFPPTSDLELPHPSELSSPAAVNHQRLLLLVTLEYQVQDLDRIAFQTLSAKPGCINRWRLSQFISYFQEYMGGMSSALPAPRASSVVGNHWLCGPSRLFVYKVHVPGEASPSTSQTLPSSPSVSGCLWSSWEDAQGESLLMYSGAEKTEDTSRDWRWKSAAASLPGKSTEALRCIHDSKSQFKFWFFSAASKLVTHVQTQKLLFIFFNFPSVIIPRGASVHNHWGTNSYYHLRNISCHRSPPGLHT